MSMRHWIMEYILRDIAFLVSQSLSFTVLHMAYWVPEALTSNQGIKIKRGMIYHLNGTQWKGLEKANIWKWAEVLLRNTTVTHIHFFGLIRNCKPWDNPFLKLTLLKFTDPQSKIGGESLLLQSEREISLGADLNRRLNMENLHLWILRKTISALIALLMQISWPVSHLASRKNLTSVPK